MSSFKVNQWIIAGVAGVATATGVAVATLQSQDPAPAPTSPSSVVVSPSPAATSSPATPRTPSQPATPASPIVSSPVVTPTPVPVTPLVVTPQRDNCRISMARVNDPDPPLNVRRTPEVVQGNIVGQLENGTFVSVVAEERGWLQIQGPVEGWIAQNRTEYSCAMVKQPVSFLPGGNSAIIQGEIIGGGSHAYLLRLSRGQTLTVENLQGVFPMILGPDQRVIAGDPYQDGNREEWTGEVPVAGEYTFQLDSNYKGFEYEFLVKVE